MNRLDVIPAQAGVQCLATNDAAPRVRGDDKE